MARLRGLVVVLSILFISLFCTNIVSSLPEEVAITILDENPIYKYEEPLIESLAEFQSIENFGDQQDFWTYDFQASEWFEVRATLLAVGQHCYIYMDNRTITSMGQYQAIERSKILSSEFRL